MSKFIIGTVLPRLWQDEPARRGLPIVAPLFVLMGLACLIGSMDQLNNDEWWFVSGFAMSAFMFVAFVLAVALFHRSVKRGWRRASSVPRADRPGQIVSMEWSVGVKYLYYAMILALAAACGSMATLVIMYGPPNQTVGLTVPILVVGAIYLGVAPFGRIVRKRGAIGLGLGSRGVYDWEWFGCRFVPWESITGIYPARRLRVEVVADEEPARERDPEENWIGRIRLFRRRIHVDAAYLNVNPAAAYYALAFYLRHAEFRTELDDERGVERIRAGDFPGIADDIRQHGYVPQDGSATGGSSQRRWC